MNGIIPSIIISICFFLVCFSVSDESWVVGNYFKPKDPLKDSVFV